eukprot:758599-Hanusia_phi.AAC.1
MILAADRMEVRAETGSACEDGLGLQPQPSEARLEQVDVLACSISFEQSSLGQQEPRNFHVNFDRAMCLTVPCRRR